MTGDTIYRTWNAQWNCFDQGDGLPGDFYCRTDNATFGVYANSSVETAGYLNVLETVSRFNATNLTAQYDSSPVFTGSGETDVIYRNNRGGMVEGDLGVAWCDDAETDRLCDQHYVSFWFPNPDLDVVMRETGHAVGLTHGAQAARGYDHCAGPICTNMTNNDTDLYCMRTPRTSPPSENLGPLNTHNINEVY